MNFILKFEKNKFGTEQVPAAVILWRCIWRVLGWKFSGHC